MGNCLLCNEPFKQKVQFSAILFLRKDKAGLCLACQSRFEAISEEHCPSCYKSAHTSVCRDCQYWKEQGEEVQHTSLYAYNNAMAEYFSHYKFQSDYVLRAVFAKECRRYLSQQTGYSLVPIPISPKRMEERGFNQVEGVLEAAGLPFETILGKEERQKQSEKTRQERLELEQPFYLLAEKRVPEKIILIDDIYTTGATIQLAKGLLMKNGAKIVKTFSIAR